jgi:hypothetical protein
VTAMKIIERQADSIILPDGKIIDTFNYFELFSPLIELFNENN